jgi:peroxiredoxin
MKKSTLFFVGISFILAMSLQLHCTQVGSKGKNYEIHGSVDGLFEGTVYLGKEQDGKLVYTDSALIHEKRFVLKHGIAEMPEIYYLVINDKQVMVEFFVENSYIEIYLDITRPEECQITGSSAQAEYDEFRRNNSVYENRQKDLYRRFDAAREKGDTMLISQLDSTYKTVFDDQTDYIIKYVMNNKTSVVAAFLAARSLAPLVSTDDLEKLTANFSPEISKSVYVQELTSEISIRRSCEIGAEAPELALPDSLGIINSLHNLRGKYVLIYYWASWNGNCRLMNKKLTVIRNKYKSKPFVIFAVSVDEKHSAWAKVVKTDGLNAIHVCSLRGAMSSEVRSYAVNEIPKFILVNPEGIIINRDFDDKQLEILLKNSIR